MPKTFFSLINVIMLSIATLSVSAQAAELFPNADIKAGKALVESHCIVCHAKKYGGDGSAIYTRKESKIKTAKALVEQVRMCSTMLDIKWFDEEEVNVAAYLNNAYYHLAQ